ncbi:uncharacterized protein J7T54_001405 [Emericellopsis cladophorae]|uniref:Uncharacterized protein n=1 Tax=Emericellopsis cladophorae TaxID=2686198 RepID=A0A9P9Y1J3_9HYPO|nr:uncharacterized protein J7T54_001405 [Emericellopsis cladophorae]KAI6781443.1 hypothetical protein J7T54_001405 [Emericellopsis cladophorae]
MPSSAAPEAAPSHTCHCGKVFLRKEHLRRHQATHFQPSFQCPTCGRSFTRNDVLKRHLVVHASRSGKGSARNWRACDACHENKTKCNGGTPCGFCVKKDLCCTTDRPQAAKDDSTRVRGREAEETLPAEMLVQQEARSRGTSETVSYHVDREPRAQSFVEQGVAHAGLSRVLSAVSSLSAGADWATESRPHERYDEWMSCCLDRYLGRFHERWPVVHAPSFDRTTDNALLVGSMTMVGSWYQDGLLVRDSLIAINDRIMSRVTKLLANDDLDESKAWPLETYQIGLLNIVFAFETGTQFAPARRLLSLILLCFRHRRIFDPDSVENHRNVHYPGTFEPWVYNQRSQWKNLSAVAFKVDTYLALLFNEPPLLHAEELQLSLPCTFASENAAGIVRFFQRAKREPPEREHIAVADYVLYPEWFEEQMSHTALEDINLGLLGCYRDIWRHVQNQRGNGHVRLVLAGPLSERLELWKSKLDAISRTLGGTSNTDDTVRRGLAMSYLCLEEPGDPGWEASVLARMAAHFMNATMLYHMLHMHLTMDARVVYAFAIGRWSLVNTAHVPQSLFNTAALQSWARWPPGRAAVVQALLALRSYENGASMTAGGTNLCSDPIAHVSLATAGMVLRAWFQGREVACCCCPGSTMALPELNLDDAQGWIENGVSVSVAGVALCRCQWTCWMGRCVEALVKGAALWELRADVIETLREPIPSLSLDSA